MTHLNRHTPSTAACLRSWSRAGVTLALTLLVVGTGLTAAGGPWSVAQPDVRIQCPLTIGGSFQAKTAALSGSLTAPAGASVFGGMLAVDLRTIDTGISLRNDHLREKYLEVDKPGYDTATLSQIELKGVAPDGAGGKGTFSGLLTLHGTMKSVAGPAEVRPAGSGTRVKASFPLKLSDYNIPEPRYLGVGVKDTVQVEVTFTASTP